MGSCGLVIISAAKNVSPGASDQQLVTASRGRGQKDMVALQFAASSCALLQTYYSTLWYFSSAAKVHWCGGIQEDVYKVL